MAPNPVNPYGFERRLFRTHLYVAMSVDFAMSVVRAPVFTGAGKHMHASHRHRTKPGEIQCGPKFVRCRWPS